MHSMESINAEFERQKQRRIRSGSLSVAEQTQLLAKFRNRFVWSLLCASLALYSGLLIVVLEFPGVMSMSVYGELNLGLTVVVAQFALTIATFWGYCAWAERAYDPRSADLLCNASSPSSGASHE
jgi:uncharacterized membrane protein (DUF485 family)